MSEAKILTLHPDGKQGVNISQAKYDTMRAAIIGSLQDAGELSLAELNKAVDQRLVGQFDGSVGWYLMSVKLDLEARDEIERVPGSKPQRLRLATPARD